MSKKYSQNAILTSNKRILIRNTPKRKKKDPRILVEFPDEVLILKYRETHDPEIIGILYDRYIHLVLGICLKYLKNIDKAQDAVMDIFESLFDHLRNQDIRQFSGWLYQVSKNHCLMKLRKMKIYSFTEEDINHAKIIDSFVESDQDLHLYKERESSLTKLEGALKSLGKKQEQCLRLFFLENRSYLEVSNITGFEIKKVKSYIQNGKRNLKKILVENEKK